LGCSKYAGYFERADLTRLEDVFDIQKMSLSGIEKVTMTGAENICQIICATTQTKNRR
jgi:hypothetical protein